MIHAFAGYETWPVRDTLIILFPSITTTESRTGAPPFPSIRVPPSTTSAAGCCEYAGERLQKIANGRKRAKRRHDSKCGFLIRGLYDNSGRRGRTADTEVFQLIRALVGVGKQQTQ